MSMLREERKALRDEFERVYGIHLREDDELLPILHFISNATKLGEINTNESNRLIAEMKDSYQRMISDCIMEHQNALEQSTKLLVASTHESRNILTSQKKELESLPKLVNDLRHSISRFNIPERITVKRVSFEEATMSFLWKYFFLSLMVMLIIVGFAGSWIYQQESQIRDLKVSKQWLEKYYEKMSKDSPEATKEFLEQNPLPTNEQINSNN